MTPPRSSRPTALRESDHRRVVFNENPLVIGEGSMVEKENPKSEAKGKGKGKWRTRPFKKGGKGKKGEEKEEERTRDPRRGRRGSREVQPPRSLDRPGELRDGEP